MGKVSKRKKQKFIRVIILAIVIQIVLLASFTYFLFKATNATLENTSVIDVKILDVFISDGSNKLATVYLETPAGYYRTDWKTYDKKNYSLIESEELEKNLTKESSITLTVLDNSQKSSILYGETMYAVDIRNDSTVYYDITNYNEWQKENRIVLIVAFIVVEIIVILLSAFQVYLNYPYYHKKKKETIKSNY